NVRESATKSFLRLVQRALGLLLLRHIAAYAIDVVIAVELRRCIAYEDVDDASVAPAELRFEFATGIRDPGPREPVGFGAVIFHVPVPRLQLRDFLQGISQQASEALVCLVDVYPGVEHDDAIARLLEQ